MRTDIGILLRQAQQARRIGNARLARTALDDAIAIARREDAPADLAYALRESGELERSANPALALEHYAEAVRLFRDTHDPARLAHTVRHYADIAAEQNLPADAEPAYREALRIYAALPDANPLDHANALRAMAAFTGETEEAWPLWEQARDLYRRAAVPPALVECSLRMAAIARRQGFHDEVRRLLHDARAAAAESGDPELIARAASVD